MRSGACSGTDKVNGISTAGDILCAADQTGGAGGSTSQHQVNGTNLGANDPINFQDTGTIAFSNPSAGNLQATLKDSAVTAAKLAASNPSSVQLSGLDDDNVAAGALSPNRIAGIAEVQSSKGAPNGHASLNSSSLVVQNPANAQVSPAASKVPVADATGKLDDGWFSPNVSLLGSSISLATEVSGTLPLSSGGTSQTTWTPSRCVQVNSAGTALESAPAPCGGGGGDAVSVNGAAASDADFDDATPAPPANSVNLKWQKDSLSPNNISAHVEYDSGTMALNAGRLGIKANGVGPAQVDETENYNWTGTHNFGGATVELPHSAGAAPSATGRIAYDTTQKTWEAFSDSTSTTRPLVRAAPCRPQFSSSDTITASLAGTTETNFSTNCSIPANFFRANKAIRVVAMFSITTSGSAPTITLRLKLGSAVLYSSAAGCCDTPSLTNRGMGGEWYLQGTGAPGASVGIETGHVGTYATAPSSFGTLLGNGTAQPVNVATNTAQTLQISVQYSSNTAGNSITLLQLVIEEIN